MRLLGQIGYRYSQFVRGLRATVTAGDEALLQATLAPPQLVLFKRMPVDAQRHSLNVLTMLQRAGYHVPSLAVAALLHDVGKVAAADAGRPIGLWLRGPMVILEAFFPWLLSRLASQNPKHGWRYALYVQQQHPQIGAHWAADAGCSALSCWLIAHHQEKHQEMNPAGDKRIQLLAALQWADAQN